MLSLPAPVVPFVIASLLSIHGLRRRSLSPSGAAAAFTVGFMMFSGPLLVFGVSLIVFYLIGSRATKGVCINLDYEDYALSEPRNIHRSGKTVEGKVGGWSSRDWLQDCLASFM